MSSEAGKGKIQGKWHCVKLEGDVAVKINSFVSDLSV